MCNQFGMSEEQFWKSNPRIIKVWYEAYKTKENRQNELMHVWWGNYGLSAMAVSLSHILSPMFTKHKSTLEYIDEPVRIFPKTEAEIQAEKDEMTERFIAWGNSLIEQFGNKTDD